MDTKVLQMRARAAYGEQLAALRSRAEDFHAVQAALESLSMSKDLKADLRATIDVYVKAALLLKQAKVSYEQDGKFWTRSETLEIKDVARQALDIVKQLQPTIDQFWNVYCRHGANQLRLVEEYERLHDELFAIEVSVAAMGIDTGGGA